MSDHALGLRLRQLLLASCTGAEPCDGRRLQALVGDVCRHEQQELLPPLRHLVLAPAFQSALRSAPPLGDRRCRQRWLQELRPVFTPALCQRMEAVVEGLLGLPEAPRPDVQPSRSPAPGGSAPGPERLAPLERLEPPQPPQPPPQPPEPESQPPEPESRPRSRQGGSLQPLVLAMAMAASVAVGMGAARLWWDHEAARQQPASAPFPQGSAEVDRFRPSAPAPDSSRSPFDPADPASPGVPAAPAEPADARGGSADPFAAPGSPSAARESPSDPSRSSGAPQPPPLPPLPSAGAPGTDGAAGVAGSAGVADRGSTAAEPPGEAALESAAAAQLQGLYSSLSRQDFAAAQTYFSPRAADQFDPAFFRQFSRVAVSRLETIGRSPTTLTLRGVVRFAYPDGSSQLESRSFTFSTLDNPPRVISSAFGTVLQPRARAVR